MSDSSTDSSVIHQKVILLRYLHPGTYASIGNLKNARAEGVFDSIKRELLKCVIDIDFYHCTLSARKMIN